MFGSVVLEVLLGLVFLYAWFSLACSAATEFLETFLAQRGKQLATAILGMLGQELKTRFYQHGLVRSLSKGERLPSYVPPQSFAVVTLELLGITQENYRETIADLGGHVGETLRSLLLHVTGFDGLIAALQQWFNDTMERCSGWFRRRARWASFAMALVLATLLNVDSLDIATALYEDTQLRLAVASQAQSVVLTPGTLSRPDGAAVLAGQQAHCFPLGWEHSRFCPRPYSQPLPRGIWFWLGPVLSKLLGLLTTALAGSLGAAFWFDALKKIVALRTSLAPRGLLESVDVVAAPAATTQVVSTPGTTTALPVLGLQTMVPATVGLSGPRTSIGIAPNSPEVAVYPVVDIGTQKV